MIGTLPHLFLAGLRPSHFYLQVWRWSPGISLSKIHRPRTSGSLPSPFSDLTSRLENSHAYTLSFRPPPCLGRFFCLPCILARFKQQGPEWLRFPSFLKRCDQVLAVFSSFLLRPPLPTYQFTFFLNTRERSVRAGPSTPNPRWSAVGLFFFFCTPTSRAFYGSLCLGSA